MLIGRKTETERLQGVYEADKSGIMIVYGRRGIGKTTLVRLFLQDKSFAYYPVRCVTNREQQNCVKSEWHITDQTESLYEVLESRFATLFAQGQGKAVFVFEDFENLFLESGGLFSDILRFYLAHYEERSVLLVFTSSSVRFVENEMTGRFGTAAKLITGFIKLKEFTFMEHARLHKDASLIENIYQRAILGGVPAYLSYWREEESLKQNVLRLFLSEKAVFFSEPENYLKQELRELSAYNTILAALASGKYRLNELYEATGFSRAKISVYLKNLSELDVTEKLFSVVIQDAASTERGLYRIREPLIAFWYRFVYQNLADIIQGKGEQVYEERVAPYLSAFALDVFREICSEYLVVLNDMKQLARQYETFGMYFGKNGILDVIARDRTGNSLVAFCYAGKTPMTKDMVESYLGILQQSGMAQSELYFFSLGGFTKEVADMAGDRRKLVDAKDM